MSKVIPFHRRAAKLKAVARQRVEKAKDDAACRAFDEPERFRGAILRLVRMVRSTVCEGNRDYMIDGTTSSLQVHQADADVVVDALAHVEEVLSKARIVPCSPAARHG